MGFRFFLAALLLLLASTPSFADSYDENAGLEEEHMYRWLKWTRGVDLGLNALGHFGVGNSIDSPPGGFGIQARYHIWYEHLVEAHATAGFGVQNQAFLLGGGFKLNIVEYLEDTSGYVRQKGIQVN